MKKLIAALYIVTVSITACTETSTTKETTENAETTEKTEGSSITNPEPKVDDRTQEMKDSTKMLDKKLSDPNSSYSPDSLK